MTAAAPPALDSATRAALADLLLSMADDEFVIGFIDSEWTGIAPILEEDVAMSSISQDELGHARALYELLAELLDDGRDADAIAFDREPDEYRHARLLDHGRGDWADTIARRFLYDAADAERLETIGDGWAPLAELVAKIRREERYHRMHAEAWINRLAGAGGDARARLVAALAAAGSEAATVLATPDGEDRLLAAGIMTRSFADARAAWVATVQRTLGPLGLASPMAADPALAAARTDHAEPFRGLHADFTSVRRSDPGAAW